MTKNVINMPASFEIVGSNINLPIRALVDITLSNIQIVNKIIGNKSYGKMGNVTINAQPYPLKVCNAKIVALKKGIVYDFDITDEDGNYTLFLEDGIYDIIVQSQTVNREIKNYQHTNGIGLYSEVIVSGQIKTQHHDVIEFSELDLDTGREKISSSKRLIQGRIVGENKQPIENAEIVVYDEFTKEVLAFVKTDCEGKYKFAISKSDCTVIIRSPYHHAKIFRNYQFTPDKGFLPYIIDNSLMFKQGGESLCILS